MKRHLSLLVALAMAWALSSPTPARAEASRTEFSGFWSWNLVPPFTGGGSLAPVNGGGFKLRDVLAKGEILFEGIELEAHLSAVINGNLDETLSGPIMGSCNLSSPDGTILFVGRFAGSTVGLQSVGHVMLRGVGPFAGQTLHFSFVERDTPDNYDFEGWLLKPAK